MLYIHYPPAAIHFAEVPLLIFGRSYSSIPLLRQVLRRGQGRRAGCWRSEGLGDISTRRRTVGFKSSESKATRSDKRLWDALRRFCRFTRVHYCVSLRLACKISKIPYSTALSPTSRSLVSVTVSVAKLNRSGALWISLNHTSYTMLKTKRC